MGEESGIPPLTKQSPITVTDHPENLKLVIGPSEAESMARSRGLASVEELLPSIVHSGRCLARPPISAFHVCAAALSGDGSVYLGVNLEFPSLPLHHSVHAEQFLVTNLSLHRQSHIRKIVVSAYPCGHCRQFLQEIRGAPEIQILVPGDDESAAVDGGGSYRPLSYFLANPFGPDDLLGDDVPLILENHDNGLVLANDEKMMKKNGNLCNGYSKFDERGLTMAALEAANGSHAPYSGCPSGVALVDLDGKIYKGSYMESAAYNPSLGPAQAAVVAYMVAMGGGYDRIVGAALVEKDGAVVRQEQTVRLFFEAVAPNCEFQVYHCNSSSSSSSTCSSGLKS